MIDIASGDAEKVEASVTEKRHFLMAEGRKSSVDRTLTLVRALADSVEGLTLDEMAEEIGQKRRSAERLRDIIAMHFEINIREDGRKKRFRIRDSLRRHYTRPNAQELAALQSEADAAIKGGSPRAALLDPLLVKLRASLDDAEKHRIDPDFSELSRLQRTLVAPGPFAPVAEDTLTTVMQAIMAGQCLEFQYHAQTMEKPQWRRIAPCGLLHASVSYLVGTFPDHEWAPITYRLDRMSDVEISDVPNELPESFSLDDWLAKSFGIWRGASHDISLRIFAASATRALGWRFHPKQTVDLLNDGSVRITFSCGGLRELAEHLFTWAGELEIEGPDELKAVMAERLDAARIMIGTSTVAGSAQ